jgi:hypothetical protein
LWFARFFGVGSKRNDVCTGIGGVKANLFLGRFEGDCGSTTFGPNTFVSAKKRPDCQQKIPVFPPSGGSDGMSHKERLACPTKRPVFPAIAGSDQMTPTKPGDCQGKKPIMATNSRAKADCVGM